MDEDHKNKDLLTLPKSQLRLSLPILGFLRSLTSFRSSLCLFKFFPPCVVITILLIYYSFCLSLSLFLIVRFLHFICKSNDNALTFHFIYWSIFYKVFILWNWIVWNKLWVISFIYFSFSGRNKTQLTKFWVLVYLKYKVPDAPHASSSLLHFLFYYIFPKMMSYWWLLLDFLILNSLRVNKSRMVRRLTPFEFLKVTRGTKLRVSIWPWCWCVKCKQLTFSFR